MAISPLRSADRRGQDFLRSSCPAPFPLTVLEEAADHQAALVLRHIGDVLAVQLDKAVIDVEAAGNRIEQVDFPAPLEPMIVTKSP